MIHKEWEVDSIILVLNRGVEWNWEKLAAYSDVYFFWHQAFQNVNRNSIFYIYIIAGFTHFAKWFTANLLGI